MAWGRRRAGTARDVPRRWREDRPTRTPSTARPPPRPMPPAITSATRAAYQESRRTRRRGAGRMPIGAPRPPPAGPRRHTPHGWTSRCARRWRNAPTSSRQFFSVATCAPGIIGMGNCLRTRIWSAGDARRAPPGSRTLAPFFRPMAQTGARFFCASTARSRMRVRLSIFAFGL